MIVSDILMNLQKYNKWKDRVIFWESRSRAGYTELSKTPYIGKA